MTTVQARIAGDVREMMERFPLPGCSLELSRAGKGCGMPHLYDTAAGSEPSDC